MGLFQATTCFMFGFTQLTYSISQDDHEIDLLLLGIHLSFSSTIFGESQEKGKKLQEKISRGREVTEKLAMQLD